MPRTDATRLDPAATGAPSQFPDDARTMLELAQRLEELGREHLPQADRLCAELIARHPHTTEARLAAEARTRIAQASIRCVDHGELRHEVVRYIADALAAFDALGTRRREQVALEIALLSQKGLNIADPAPKYALRSLPGSYSGLHLLAIMYAAFRQIDPAIDVGADFLREYELAQAGADPQVPPT